MSSNKIAGIIMTIAGICGIFYSVMTISDDTSRLFGFSYTPPFTTHEITVLVILGGSVLIGILGLAIMLSSGSKGEK